MNREDFQQLSELRLGEAKALLDAGYPNGAYYLAGYAVECALKACIAKRTREYDFPEKESQGYYTHDLQKLVGSARLNLDLDQARQGEPALDANWTIVVNWSEGSRYARKTDQEATDLIRAIEEKPEGILPWIMQRW
ncbi:MAG TPA: HEPN domain-containing protein [Terracidiphilus sp.]|nr:HEPN domain-containing protein [Terracidiphilus sp.]